MKISSKYLLLEVFLCAILVLISCNNNKQSINILSNHSKVKNDTITHVEITCELIKNEKQLNKIIDSLELIYGKSKYACRCSPDHQISNDINKIVVQILQDDSLRLRGIALFKYDTLTNLFSNYNMEY